MAGQSPAGWYPDPLGRFQHRYWNGGEWSEHVANAGFAAIDPLATSTPAVAGATAATDAHTADLVPSPVAGVRRTGRTVPKWLWVTGGVLSTLFVTTALAATVAPTPSRVRAQPSAVEPSSSTPRRPVTITSSSTTTTTSTTTTSTTTTTTLPPLSTTVKPQAPVFVPPPPAPSSDCDPNYTPCVPVSSDVDCAGGSGNGPAYVSGPVQVIGTDIYDLDRDGNGTGCEQG